MSLKTPHFFPYQPDAALIVRLRPLKVRELLLGKSTVSGGGILPWLAGGNLPGGTWRALLDREDSLLDEIVRLIAAPRHPAGEGVKVPELSLRGHSQTLAAT